MKLQVPPGYKLMDGKFLVPEEVPPPQEKDGWGEVVGLRAGLTVWSPEGDLMHNKDWRSRSFLRNFGKWVEKFFDGTANASLISTSGTPFTARVNSNTTGLGSGGARLVPNPSGLVNIYDCGAGLVIGTGTVPAGEASSRTALKTLAAPASYSNFGAGVYTSVTTTILDTTQIVFTITEGYTAGVSGWSITEIGLLIYVHVVGQTSSTVIGTPVLMAYDEFASSPVSVPAGGVCCPRYTLTFTA